MQLSLLEYLRVRVRDAVLAGVNDALDIVEGPEATNNDHAAADAVKVRLGATSTPGLERPEAEPSNDSPESPGASQANEEVDDDKPNDFESELDARLAEAAPVNPSRNGVYHPTDDGPAEVRKGMEPRKRGRPRKDGSS